MTHETLRREVARLRRLLALLLKQPTPETAYDVERAAEYVGHCARLLAGPVLNEQGGREERS